MDAVARDITCGFSIVDLYRARCDHAQLSVFVDAVHTALSACTLNIRTLQCIHTPIGDVGLAQITDALLLCNRMLMMALFEAELTDLSAPAVARLITSLPLLTALEIDHNHITDAGAAVIADALPRGHLKSLYLQQNDIGDRGMLVLFSAAVKTNTSLELTANPVTNGGIHALARFIARMPTQSTATIRLTVTHETYEGNLAVEAAYKRAPDFRRVVTLYTPSLTWLPITKFLRRDGDNAIMHRVVRFMLRRQ